MSGGVLLSSVNAYAMRSVFQRQSLDELFTPTGLDCSLDYTEDVVDILRL